MMFIKETKKLTAADILNKNNNKDNNISKR